MRPSNINQGVITPLRNSQVHLPPIERHSFVQANILDKGQNCKFMVNASFLVRG